MTQSSPKNIHFILGIKLGMSQVFGEKNEAIPVTLVKAGPCQIIQIKKTETDGHNAVQIGFMPKKKINKPIRGHIKKQTGQERGFRYIREFRLKDPLDLEEKTTIKADIFQKGNKVTITGTSKAKGFQGVVKRHGFKGAPASHGTKHAHRQPGSIGSTDAARVFKGVRMAGRMGSETITMRGFKIIDVREKENLLVIKGAIPGRIGGLLKISQANI